MFSRDRYLSGEFLYGDDFSAEQIAEWNAQEAEGYSGLSAARSDEYSYAYHAWNTYHGYRYLPKGVMFRSVLGLGSAYGEEFAPIAPRIGTLTVVESSQLLRRDSVEGVPIRYLEPRADNSIPLEDESVDLVCCLGVLHHIPNVTFVISEMARVLRSGGIAVIREPIVSMGDWSTPRRGLTRNERGIPRDILIDRLRGVFEEVHCSLCGFPVVARLARAVRIDAYNSMIVTRVDALLSRAFAWNVNYHPITILHRFRPTSMFAVVKKP